MFKIPSQLTKQLTQTNRSDVLGNLLGSFNLDLNINVGKVRITRTLVSTTTATDSDLTNYPIGFKAFTVSGVPYIFTVAGSKVHKNDGTVNGSFSVDALSLSPTDCNSLSDIEIYNNALYVTGVNSLYKLTSSGTWAANSTSVSSASILCNYADNLYIVSAPTDISYLDSGGTIHSSGSNTLSLGDGNTYSITFLKAAANKIWIGTVNKKGGKGYIYEWDGAAEETTRSYRLQAAGALSCVIKDDIPYVTDSNGKVLVYNSGSFQEAARLPIHQKNLKNMIATSNRFIHSNGMAVIDGKVNILIGNIIDDFNSSIQEFCPSGVWELDEDSKSLYHKFSASYTPTNSNTVTDWGQNRISVPGALVDMKISDNSSDANGWLLFGASYYLDATTTTTGIFFNDTADGISNPTQPTQKFGYLVTSKLESSQITDVWQTLYLRYKKFLSASDKIVAKFRIEDPDFLETTITWTSTTTFTTTTDITAYAPGAYGFSTSLGGEVEIVAGKGGGMCAHILSVVNSSGTYTVTLDETFTGATSGTAKARFQNWRKLKSITGQTSQFEDMGLPLATTTPWIEIKVCMTFTSPNMQFDELDIQNINSLTALSVLPGKK